jgi:hypothetical protein
MGSTAVRGPPTMNPAFSSGPMMYRAQGSPHQRTVPFWKVPATWRLWIRGTAVASYWLGSTVLSGRNRLSSTERPSTRAP